MIRSKHYKVGKKIHSAKFPRYNYLSLLLIPTILGFFVSSLYLAITSGIGPFSSLLQTNSINRVASEEDCGSGYKWDDIRGCVRTNNPALTKTLPPLGTPKPTPKTTPKNNSNGVPIAERSCDARTNSTQICTYNATCICKPIIQAVIKSPKVCNVNTGVNIEVGKYAATGYGLDKDGNRCKENGCSARECVEIKADCSHGPSVKCHEQNATKPGSVIMPPSAGPEYTNGKTPVEVKEALAKGENLIAKPKEQCYDKSASGAWVIVTDGTPKSTDSTQRCSNGDWKKVMIESDYSLNLTKSEQDRINDLQSACVAGGKIFVGKDCLSKSELDNLIQSCQKDQTKIIDLTTGECIKNPQPIIPIDNKLISSSNCNTEQIIEGQKVYIDCSGAFSTLKFCTGGTFDANHDCILPPSKVVISSTKPSPTIIPVNLTNSSYSTIDYLNQKNYSEEKVVGGGSWSTAGCGVMAGAMVFSLVDGKADPYKYNALLAEHGGVTSNGTGWFDQHKVILEENNFDVVPVYGSVADKRNQISEYAKEDVPVWINAYIENGAGSWIGHHTLAVGVDKVTGDIILDDPYYGKDYHMPIERFDIDCTHSSCPNGTTSWVMNAIIPPEGTI